MSRTTKGTIKGIGRSWEYLKPEYRNPNGPDTFWVETEYGERVAYYWEGYFARCGSTCSVLVHPSNPLIHGIIESFDEPPIRGPVTMVERFFNWFGWLRLKRIQNE